MRACHYILAIFAQSSELFWTCYAEFSQRRYRPSVASHQAQKGFNRPLVALIAGGHLREARLNPNGVSQIL